jgi:hypothetical protein
LINLIDLAGCEKLDAAGGDRLKEANNINLGLSSLIEVIR